MHPFFVTGRTILRLDFFLISIISQGIWLRLATATTSPPLPPSPRQGRPVNNFSCLKLNRPSPPLPEIIVT